MRAFDALDEHMPDRDGASELVVIRSDEQTVGSADFAAFVERALREGATIEGLEIAGPGGKPPTNPTAALPRSQDGHAVLIPLARSGGDDEEIGTELVELREELDGQDGFSVDVTGQTIVDHDLDALSQTDLQEGELHFGLPAALIVLLLVVGTVVGAILPLLLAFVAIIAALALAALVGVGFDLSVFLVNMLSGMGLALGVDYSLFVLSRFREERARGVDRDAAIVATGHTAGRAVLYSGVTFVIALSGMLLVPTTIMRSLALGAVLVGITAVAAALTLLPAVLRLLGDRVDRGRIPFVHQGAGHASTDWRAGGWARLTRHVMRRPWPWAIGVTALLLLAASPLLDLRTGAGGVSTMPIDAPSRHGYEEVQRDFPEATFAPARVIVRARDVTAAPVTAGIDRLRAALAQDERFGEPAQEVAQDGRLLELAVPVGADSLSTDAVAAVRALRADLVPDAFGPGAAERSADGARPLVQVGGETALNVDYFDIMRDWAAPVIAIVLGLSFLVLMVVFRSIVVPIKAIVLNLLSVGATYGLLVLVFQKGVGVELLGMRQVEVIEAWVPLFLFSVLFGLSMDYHMFLLTRIRERGVKTGDTREAVEWGVSTTARLITGAALIIVAVFAGFARGDLIMFQQMGTGVAVALLIDATVIRGILLPASMVLLGERNWYLPSWLEWIPRVDLDH